MKKIIIIIALVFFTSTAFARKELGDFIDDLPKQAANYAMALIVSGQTNATFVEVDDVTKFTIQREDGGDAQQRYDIYYYLDGRYSGQALGVLLPYDFQQTYRGLLAGEYKVMFVAIDRSKNIGKAETIIKVRHNK